MARGSSAFSRLENLGGKIAGVYSTSAFSLIGNAALCYALRLRPARPSAVPRFSLLRQFRAQCFSPFVGAKSSPAHRHCKFGYSSAVRHLVSSSAKTVRSLASAVGFAARRTAYANKTAQRDYVPIQPPPISSRLHLFLILRFGFGTVPANASQK